MTPGVASAHCLLINFIKNLNISRTERAGGLFLTAIDSSDQTATPDLKKKMAELRNDVAGMLSDSYNSVVEAIRGIIAEAPVVADKPSGTEVATLGTDILEAIAEVKASRPNLEPSWTEVVKRRQKRPTKQDVAALLPQKQPSNMPSESALQLSWWTSVARTSRCWPGR